MLTPTQPVTSVPQGTEQWSFSSLSTYESCPHKHKLRKRLRIPEPELPMPAGKTERANDRGTRIHTGCEEYVGWVTDVMPPEMKPFAVHLERVRSWFPLGYVFMEGEWGIDHEWAQADWNSAWGRAKLDLLIMPPHLPNTAVVVDYKSGRIDGNEVKHVDQGSLYAAYVFTRFPNINRVIVEFWYCDAEALTKNVYFRNTSVVPIMRRFNQRVLRMSDDKMCPPRPDKFGCKWCGYADTEHCPTSYKG